MIRQNTLIRNKVYISEIFTSLEGEGILFGTKTMFVRFAGCHLKCYWCDTVYALSMDDGKRYSLEEVKELIRKNLAQNTYKINFTGGEPLLQHYAIIELSKFIKKERSEIMTYIESSCFDYNRFNEIMPYIDICKIEFKTKDSYAVDEKHYDKLFANEIKCLKLAIENNKIAYIKIVVSNSTSLDDFKKLIDRIFCEIKKKDLAGFIIQPTSNINEPTVDRLIGFYDLVYPLYKEVRVIPQLHKIIGAR